MKKVIKYTGIFFVLLFLIGGLGLFYLSTPEKVENKTTDLSLSAEQLYQEYEANEALSNQKYIDKIVQVKGKIAEILEDEHGAVVIVLRSEDAMAGVLCTFIEDEKAAATKLQVGNTITIKGQCTGMLMDVVLNKCIIIE